MPRPLHQAVEDAHVLATTGRELAAIEALVASGVRVVIAGIPNTERVRLELDARAVRVGRAQSSARSITQALTDSIAELRTLTRPEPR